MVTLSPKAQADLSGRCRTMRLNTRLLVFCANFGGKVEALPKHLIQLSRPLFRELFTAQKVPSIELFRAQKSP